MFKEPCRDLWRCLPDLLAFDILFKIISFVLLTPISAWLFRRFIAASGEEAIGNFDIVRFLLSPLGLTMSLLIVVLACTVLFAELAGLLVIGYGAGLNQRVTFYEALGFVAVRIRRVLGASFLILIVLLAILVPVMFSLLIVALLLLSDHDINYYLESTPPEFLTAVLAGIGIGVIAAILLVLVSVPLIFVLPQSLFQDDPMRTAFKQSRMLTRGIFLRVAKVVLAWATATILISALLNEAVFLVGRMTVWGLGDKMGALLAALGLLVGVSALLNFAVGFLSISLGCLLIVRMYGEACRSQGTELKPIEGSLEPLEQSPQWSIPKKSPLIAAVIALALAAVAVYEVLDSVRMEDNVEISAHRGASLVAPENTLSAVRQAVTDGATYVEIDVQRTSDGRVVLVHDIDLMRVGRRPFVISESTFEKLRTVDVGSQFATEFRGEQLPSLEEAIEEVRGKTKLIVELKSYSADPEPLVSEVVRILKSRSFLSETVIMSLEYRETQIVRRFDSELEVGFVSSAALGDISKLNVDFLAVSKTEASNTLIATAHAQEKEVYVWTVDDPTEMASMIDRGVDNIITNDPAALVAVLEERKDLTTIERILLRFASLYR